MKKIAFYFLPLLVFCISCEDIFVENISNREITVICPGDNWELELRDDSTMTAEVVFWWEYLKGADRYVLQLVSPDFSNINRLLFDVVVDSANKYSMALPAGQYQWRIRARNSSYSTGYVTRSFSLLEMELGETGELEEPEETGEIGETEETEEEGENE